jgi:hypothetical protein
MKQRQAPITLKTLAAEDIYRLAKQFTHQHPRPKTMTFLSWMGYNRENNQSQGKSYEWR